METEQIPNVETFRIIKGIKRKVRILKPAIMMTAEQWSSEPMSSITLATATAEAFDSYTAMAARGDPRFYQHMMLEVVPEEIEIID